MVENNTPSLQPDRMGDQMENQQKRQSGRVQALRTWLQGVLETPLQDLVPLSHDASFRHYFRVCCGNSRYVAMDAPPNKENCAPFVAIATTFQRLGLNVPIVYAQDVEQGFLLLTDFGDKLYVDALNARTSDELYQLAFDDLLLIQTCQKIENYALPKFDDPLYRQEIDLFQQWYLQQHLGVSLTSKEQAALDHMYDFLIKDLLAQPQVCIHRDYHSRNLMVVPGSQQVGMLDFQDAAWGPITYDLLSLLRDCYIDWPLAQVENWALHYHQQALQAGLPVEHDQQQFLRWFDWIGVQRHLKCLGIFARLDKLYGKPGYLQYLPRVLRYLEVMCERYSEFKPLALVLSKGV